MGKDGGGAGAPEDIHHPVQAGTTPTQETAGPLRRFYQSTSCLAGTKSGRVLQRVISVVFVWMINILAHKYFFNE